MSHSPALAACSISGSKRSRAWAFVSILAQVQGPTLSRTSVLIARSWTCKGEDQHRSPRSRDWLFHVMSAGRP